MLVKWIRSGRDKKYYSLSGRCLYSLLVGRRVIRIKTPNAMIPMIVSMLNIGLPKKALMSELNSIGYFFIKKNSVNRLNY